MTQSVAHAKIGLQVRSAMPLTQGLSRQHIGRHARPNEWRDSHLASRVSRVHTSTEQHRALFLCAQRPRTSPEPQCQSRQPRFETWDAQEGGAHPGGGRGGRSRGSSSSRHACAAQPGPPFTTQQAQTAPRLAERCVLIATVKVMLWTVCHGEDPQAQLSGTLGAGLDSAMRAMRSKVGVLGVS